MSDRPTHMIVVSKDDSVLRALGALGTHTDKGALGTVTGYSSVEAARPHLHEADALVIDLTSNGFSLVRDVRDSSWGKDVRVVMLCERPHDVWLCQQAGADQVLVKPLRDPTDVIDAIRGPLATH